jgi:hypothetical protein
MVKARCIPHFSVTSCIYVFDRARAIAQAVSRRLPIAAARVPARVRSCDSTPRLTDWLTVSRNVTLTLTLIILKIIQRHIEDKGSLNANQFAIHASHSMTLQCMRLTDHVTLNSNNKLSMAAVFLDIERAIDKTWHPGLICKLSKSQFSTSLIKLSSLAFYIPCNSILLSLIILTIFSKDYKLWSFSSCFCLHSAVASSNLSEYSRRHPFLKLPQSTSMFFPYCRKYRFAPIQNYRQNYRFLFGPLMEIRAVEWVCVITGP